MTEIECVQYSSDHLEWSDESIDYLTRVWLFLFQQNRREMFYLLFLHPNKINSLKTFKATSVSDLKQIAEKLIEQFGTKRVIAFYGEMGVGKTTLIKELCIVLGVTEIANSPTFSIVNEYVGAENKSIYHFDFYRIEKEEEVYDLGYEDYFYSDNFCFVEWPEMIPNLLPEDVVKVTLELDDENNRLISIAS